MDSTLRITDSILIDNSIEKYEDIVYEPIVGANLNTDGQDIRLTIETQEIFTHPSESFLIIEGKLRKEADDTVYANDDRITLTNNGLMHLFKCIRYDLSGQEIETVVHPGQATTMLVLLKYPDDFSKSKGLNQLWYKDTTTGSVLDGAGTNVGFKIRQDYIIKLEALERLYRSTGLIFLQWQKKFLTIIIQSLHFSSLKKKGMEKTCEKRRKKW